MSQLITYQVPAGTGVAQASEQPVSVATPLPVTGSITANNASVGVTGAAAPTSATEIGIVSGANLVAVSATNPMPGNLAQVNAVTVLTGTGAVGTGAQRVAVGADTATIAGSAPGTAGTASANVVTVQGIAGATPVLVTPDTGSFQAGVANTTGATSTSLIALVSSKRIYITSFSLSNSSATAITVNFQDGSGGTTLYTVIVPAGGGTNLGASTPIFRTSSGVALFFQASSGVTTLYVNASGYAL